jgi:hypothetical protein
MIVSLSTFWLTRVKKGSIKMTKPTVIFFGPDGPGEKSQKVFMRTLLYSTADKGQYIENMYVRLRQGESSQNFTVWVYGDNENLSRGSGLFVDRTGIATNHHFLVPKDGTNYMFAAGEYQLEVFVELVDSLPKMIYSQLLRIDQSQSKRLAEDNAGMYFDWGPDSHTYHSHIDSRPPMIPDLEKVIRRLGR